MGDIHGYCDPAFAAVKEAFVNNFAEHGETGASMCLYKDGEKVVDLWGGVKDGDGTPWEEDTLSIVFSVTKAATALCAQILIDRGKLELDALVTRYWPEFGVNGKENCTVRMMLGHQSAVPHFREPVKPGGYYDFDYMAKRVAAEKPYWEPGTSNGYHMISFGWTVGELVRRVSGKSLGQFFKDEIADPLGLDFYIGLPESEFPRMAPMIMYQPQPDDVPSPFAIKLMTDQTSLQFSAMFNSGNYYPDLPEAWKAEIGGGGGIANARSIAQMFNGLIGENAFLSKARIEDMRKPVSETDKDETLLVPTRFGQGFMLRMDNRDLPYAGASLIMPDTAFGHVGMGGSLGFADPEAGIAFGYSMTKMGGGILLNERGQALVDAAYEALG